MRSTADHQFISTDVDELDALLCAGYEQFFGTSVRPGSPERLFISWIEDAIIYERALSNHADNQNLPSRADGGNLDALAELFYLHRSNLHHAFQHQRGAAECNPHPVRHSRHGRKRLAVLGNHGR